MATYCALDGRRWTPVVAAMVAMITVLRTGTVRACQVSAFGAGYVVTSSIVVPLIRFAGLLDSRKRVSAGHQ